MGISLHADTPDFFIVNRIIFNSFWRSGGHTAYLPTTPSSKGFRLEAKLSHSASK